MSRDQVVLVSVHVAASVLIPKAACGCVVWPQPARALKYGQGRTNISTKG